MVDKMSKPLWIPRQGQAVYFYEEPDDQLTSTLWDEKDPYLIELWEEGKAFASRDEAQEEQSEERLRLSYSDVN